MTKANCNMIKSWSCSFSRSYYATGCRTLGSFVCTRHQTTDSEQNPYVNYAGSLITTTVLTNVCTCVPQLTSGILTLKRKCGCPI